MTLTNHGRPLWMDTFDQAASRKRDVCQFGPPPAEVDDEDWLAACDEADASSWLNAALLVPMAIADLARRTVGAFKSSSAAVPGSGSPAAGVDALAAGDLSNP